MDRGKPWCCNTTQRGENGLLQGSTCQWAVQKQKVSPEKHTDNEHSKTEKVTFRNMYMYVHTHTQTHNNKEWIRDHKFERQEGVLSRVWREEREEKNDVIKLYSQNKSKSHTEKLFLMYQKGMKDQSKLLVAQWLNKNLQYCLWELHTVEVLGRSYWKYLTKLHMYSYFKVAGSRLWIYPRVNELKYKIISISLFMPTLFLVKWIYMYIFTYTCI